MGEINLSALIADDKLRSRIADESNPWIKLSQIIWNETVKTCDLEKVLRIIPWCAFGSDFVPNRVDNRSRIWFRQGITNDYCFLSKDKIKVSNY